MARTASALATRLRAIMPPEWWGWGAILDGMGGPMNLAEAFLETLAANAVASTAEGVWLDAMLPERGVRRPPGATDAQTRTVFARGVTSNDVVTLQAAVDALLTGTGATGWVVESHESRIYCDDDATEYVTDFFVDEDHILGDPRTVYIVIDSIALDDEVYQAIADVGNAWRAAGIRVVMIEDSSITAPVYGLPWEEP